VGREDGRGGGGRRRPMGAEPTEQTSGRRPAAAQGSHLGDQVEDVMELQQGRDVSPAISMATLPSSPTGDSGRRGRPRPLWKVGSADLWGREDGRGGEDRRRLPTKLTEPTSCGGGFFSWPIAISHACRANENDPPIAHRSPEYWELRALLRCDLDVWGNF
jgi:hypothetical protein